MTDRLQLTDTDIAAHTRWARRLARSLLGGDPAAADDVVQEAWVAALRSAPPTDRPLRAWLAGVLRNRALQWRRSEGGRKRRERAGSRPESLPSEAALVERAETTRVLVRELLVLEDPYRSTLLLRYFEDLTPGEIAARRSVPAATVRSQLARGLAQLRARLDRLHSGDRTAWALLVAPLVPGPVPPAAAVPIAAKGWLTMKAVKIGAVVAAAGLGVFLLRPLVTSLEGAGTGGGEGADVLLEGVAKTDEPLATPDDIEVERAVAVPRTTGIAAPVSSVRAIRGRITDEAGAPVPGAVVLAATREDWIPAALDAERYVEGGSSDVVRHDTVAGEDGSFAVTGIDAGPVRIAVRADGFAPLDDDGRYLPEGEDLDLGALVLAGGVVLTGRVVDADGQGVPGALLWRKSAEDGLGFGGRQDKQARVGEAVAGGAFRVTLTPGPWRLEVTAPGQPLLVQTGVHLDPGLYEGLEFQFPRSWTISGRVVAPGAPADMDYSAFRVWMSFAGGQEEPPGMERQHRYGTTSCAADGSFVLTGLRSVDGDEPSQYSIGAHRVYGNLLRTMSEKVKVRAGATDVLLEVTAYAGIDFALEDRATGAAILEPEVWLVVEGNNHLDVSGSGTLRDDGEGRYGVFDIALRPGVTETRLRIAKEGYLDRVVSAIPLNAGKVTDIGAVRMQPAPMLEVRVTDARDGAPVWGAEVALEREDAPYLPEAADADTRIDYLPRTLHVETGADGVARARVAPGEPTSVRVTHDDYAIPPPQEVVPPRAGESIDVALEQGGTALVVVTGPDGLPVTGALVLHVVEGGPGDGRAITDPTGTARFEHLAASIHRFRLNEAPRDVGERWQETEVAPGEVRTVRLLAPVKAALEGRVTEAGIALADAELLTIPFDTRLPVGLESGNVSIAEHDLMHIASPHRTNEDGRFRIPDLEVGEWTLVVSHPTRTLRDQVPVAVARGARPERIDLDVTELEGRVTIDGEPAAGVTLYIFVASSGEYALKSLFAGYPSEPEAMKRAGIGRGTTGPDGRYRLRGVPAGVALVVAALPEGCQLTLSEPVTVASGEVLSGVDLAPARGGRIAVTLNVPERKRPMIGLYTITASPAAPTSELGGERSQRPNQEGVATLDHLAPGTWIVGVLTGFSDDVLVGPTEVHVTAGETTSLAFDVD